MSIHSLTGSVESLRRKLRAVIAVLEDPAATEHERANAQALKARLQRRLNQAGTPKGDWSDNAFRLGKWAGRIRGATSPGSPKGDWTDQAHRLGKTLRHGYKRWFSE
jgi:hypothetical protein